MGLRTGMNSIMEFSPLARQNRFHSHESLGYPDAANYMQMTLPNADLCFANRITLKSAELQPSIARRRDDE
jgi:hypothetical protein